MKNITMQDIAREAGVSRPIVSLVINRDYSKKNMRVSEVTRKRVLETAKRLGYRPNELAKSVATGKSNVIVFIGDISNEYVSRVLKGVVEETQKHNYLIKLFNLDEASLEEELDKILSHRPVGIIWRTPKITMFTRVFRECERFDIPICVIGHGEAHYKNKGIWIDTDDSLGAEKVIDYLVSTGHHNIKMMNIKLNMGYIKKRRNGFLNGMKKHNLDIDKSVITSPLGIDNICANIRNILMEKNRPTALFFSSDFIAMLCLRVASELNIIVPNELSVIGFGNLHMSAYASPALTTINEPYEIMGNVATVELFKAIKDKFNSYKKNRRIVLKTEIILRDSTSVFGK